MQRWIKRDHKPTTKFDGSEGNYELNYALPSAATPGPAHDYRKEINNASHFFKRSEDNPTQTSATEEGISTAYSECLDIRRR